ncbi:hypothetical protein MLD38_021804 [Melastoma candidum]|uniref:Uncharacterized protein n=1 Tax=Melastoma candidum TaxID=119954 RepID=A0ACB9QHQ2_9MYRT|nr:hypothetical protein MLD38_021804 [Melastoma candidum]
MAKPSTSFLQSLTKFFKKPWEITGPCASPEYLPAIPKAVDWRVPSPATPAIKPCVPTSLPETVYDIKYFPRDQRRNRSPIRKILLRKDDALKMMSERKEFSPEEFPPVYLTKIIEEDQNAIGGGYQK